MTADAVVWAAIITLGAAVALSVTIGLGAVVRLVRTSAGTLWRLALLSRLTLLAWLPLRILITLLALIASCP